MTAQASMALREQSLSQPPQSHATSSRGATERDARSPAVALLQRLYALGAQVLIDRSRLVESPVGDLPTLIVRAPPARIPPELRAEIAARKRELLDALATHPCTGCGRFAFRVPRACYWCARGHPSEVSCPTR